MDGVSGLSGRASLLPEQHSQQEHCRLPNMPWPPEAQGRHRDSHCLDWPLLPGYLKRRLEQWSQGHRRFGDDLCRRVRRSLSQIRPGLASYLSFVGGRSPHRRNRLQKKKELHRALSPGRISIGHFRRQDPAERVGDS